MKQRTSHNTKGQMHKQFQGDGTNWILIAGGALLSSLSIRLGYKLKQSLDSRQQGSESTVERKKSGGRRLRSNGYCVSQEDDESYNYISGTPGRVEIKHQNGNQFSTESEMALPLATIPPSDYNKDNGVMWASSPDRLELPQKPFHHSNSSESPCVSESGSDIFSKREVIQKLRQQLKRRDDMIMEMQDQIVELQGSLSAQLSHSSHMQSLVDKSNLDLMDSEREIQRLRKAIADHCVSQVSPNGNVFGNGHSGMEMECCSSSLKVEMLKKEVVELKEVIEGKEYLLQNYKEQKTELSVKVKELQQRLDSQLLNIL
ncbi:uncharacterized protein LOC124910483 [Impatiens glandulifera]|uniref:uncharacterized protein LOC124910483 n=1 Tax=Impatiens glandulifera TaxID=253017 RepID=UPI001FB13507|nr:uncharacterized protein LOC124910483 [Impatiens glandulifera]XP_047307081.1 uncharacterized protein LOC124910483 [Impatiens glandulifera]